MSPAELRWRVERYVELRLALGFDMRTAEKLLRDFVGFVNACGHDGPVTTRLAVQWACSTRRHGRGFAAARRLSVVRGFLVHLRASVPQTEVPGHGILGRPRRPRPYIYSTAEIEALLAAARSLGPRGSLRPYTYATLLGLLASSGLRISEATKLDVQDADLETAPACLRIDRAKFGKSRLVPLHASTAAMLRRYAGTRRRLGYDGLCSAFFVSERPGPLCNGTVRRTFVALARRVGIRGPTGPGPRLHDLRHTFAVGRLLLWYREGVDVHGHLPELSVYLGHVRPQDTYWYLTATPQLLAAAAERFGAFASPGGEP